MKVDVHWVGLDPNRRLWGFLEIPDENFVANNFYGWNKRVYTFWGARQGRLCFQSNYLNAAYSKHLVKKQKKYTEYKNDTFNARLIDEFSQFMLVKTLKGE